MTQPAFQPSTATAAKREDRIRAATPADINARIDKDTEVRVWFLASRTTADVALRLAELAEERSVERLLSENSSLLALTGTVIGGKPHPGGRDVLLMLRRLGVRSKSEIEAERHALEVLRGHFADAGRPAPAPA